MRRASPRAHTLAAANSTPSSAERNARKTTIPSTKHAAVRVRACARASKCACERVRVRACARASVCTCERVHVRACMRVFWGGVTMAVPPPRVAPARMPMLPSRVVSSPPFSYLRKPTARRRAAAARTAQHVAALCNTLQPCATRCQPYGASECSSGKLRTLTLRRDLKTEDGMEIGADSGKGCSGKGCEAEARQAVVTAA